MFKNEEDEKSNFVKNVQLERQQRSESKRKQVAVIKIQALARRYICKQRVAKGIRHDFDAVFQRGKPLSGIPALAMFKEIRKLFVVYHDQDDNERYQLLCEAIMINLDTGKEPKYWYMSVMLLKDHTSAWLSTLKKMLLLCVNKLRTIKINLASGSKAASLYLSMLVTFTDCGNWKILKIKGGENILAFMKHLCSTITVEMTANRSIEYLKEFLTLNLTREEVSVNQLIMAACNTLFIRFLRTMHNSSWSMMLFQNVFTLPGYTYHLKRSSPEELENLFAFKGFSKLITDMHGYSSMKKLYNEFDADLSLCVLGNLIYLAQLNMEALQNCKLEFKVILNGLLKNCQMYIGKNSANSKWHPIFGWCKEVTKTRSMNEAYIHILKQVKALWQQPLLGCFFDNLPSLPESESLITLDVENNHTKGGLLRRAFMKTFKKTGGLLDLNEPILMDVCSSCDLYRTLTISLVQIKLEIVAALSLQEEILVRLWRFIYSLGGSSGLKNILNFITTTSSTLPAPLVSLFTLFCECSAQLIPIIDDDELYVKQKPFRIDDLVKLSAFLNVFVFKFIWMSPASNEQNDVKSVVQQLLLILYSRDCRRSFTPNNHWHIKELKMSQFQSDLKERSEKALAVLQNIPHIIPHMERVRIFHGWIDHDKRSLGINKDYSRPSALVSVRRSRLLEDGYDQLSRYSGSELKGIIRVKFINDQGLDEAGIDQDGVFKEFLEDVIAKAFNPELNLFKMTCGEEQRLYPSPTSFIHDNHIELLEFVGKMLGKAVYEGILVDVPFASFFLNCILQQMHTPLYSSIDELPSLDPDMYKNLNFIKNYDGNVADLQLVFAYDEEILGQMVTYDLKPGGRAVTVTNSSKMSYIHLMARFRLHTQIQRQSDAFTRGFRSVISGSWLRIFSAPQLQRLISGDTENMDLSDLKNNTRYYGGYHAGHQTINWLWDIIINDFSVQDKKLFLKFVTSCSNPPLLGFNHLEPQFSIRFVDSSDDEDTGDTAGSVVRGLLSLRKRGQSSSTARLPTASTCFNLLKLPCYKKRSILKEKLRYAIRSGAGFELS